jgi:hypothetical protein
MERRSTSTLQALALALPVLALFGCNQPPPPGADSGGTETESTATDTDTGTDTSLDSGSLYPLVDGATWTYRRSTTSGQVLGTEVMTITSTDWNGSPAWLLTDEPDAMGDWNESTLIQAGDLYLRVHRVEYNNQTTLGIYDYEPGFVRASEAWTSVAPPVEYLYDRTAYDPSGLNPSTEARGHTFEVLAIDESVTVPAGTFDNCVLVERVRTIGNEAGTIARFWFHPGVGKVREERPADGEVEELLSVSIPGGAQYP